MLAAELGRLEAIEKGERVDDEKLVERACGGERAAFDMLYERYFARVYAYVARRIGNRSDVEETVQEVFLGVFMGLASFRREGAFAAWVLGIARRTIAGRYKKKQHLTIPLDEAGEAPAIDRLDSTLRREPSPLEHYECGERFARIEAAAEGELSAEQRRLFALHHLEHLPIHEIATRLSKSEDSVKSNLYRARRLLLSR
jgi:RNA polymerase sigma-70 factor (ECF subfamily)